MDDIEKKPFDEYFDKNFFILRACGLWITSGKDPTRERIWRSAYTFFLFFWLFCYQPAESAVMFFNPSLPVFLRSLRDQFNHFLCFFKIFTWFRHRRVILGLVDVMQDRKYYYDEYGYVKTDEVVKFYKKQSDRWMILFLFFVNFICLNMTILTFGVFFLDGKNQYEEDENGNLVYAQQLAVNLITPFERASKASFVLHFLFEIFPLTIHAWMIVGLDSLFTSLMSCVSAHLVILQQVLRTVRPRCSIRLNLEITDRLHDPKNLEEEMLSEMKKCIRHLNMLLDPIHFAPSVSDKLENIYNRQTLFQVMTSLFEMCLCLYFLSMTLNEEMGPELTYLVSTSFQLLLYCWFGNAVTEASISLNDSIYEGDWLSTNKAYKSCMLITMTRMRKPIFMTIGKFTPLTFTTFLSIGRVAYSFFTVLKSDAIST